jgi:hypothetical protein
MLKFSNADIQYFFMNLVLEQTLAVMASIVVVMALFEI